jgi:hypothetical protein
MAQLTLDNWLAIGSITIAVLAPVGQVMFQRHLGVWAAEGKSLTAVEV